MFENTSQKRFISLQVLKHKNFLCFAKKKPKWSLIDIANFMKFLEIDSITVSINKCRIPLKLCFI